MAEYPALYRDQIAAAQTALVSKMEQADCGACEALCAELRRINPSAEILSEHYTHMGPDFWCGLLSRRCDGTLVMGPEPSEMTALPDSYSLRCVSLGAPEQLILLAEGVIRGVYGNIIRAKGTVNTGDVSLRLDIADGQYTICGTEQGDGKMVFIGTGIDRVRLDAIFHPAGPFRRPRRIQYRK